MSVRVMALVWDSTVPAPERFTLLALADRADEEGVCWPSIPTLARKCRTGESTIRRHLAALRKSNVVVVAQRWNNSSMYTINLGRLRELVDDVTPSQSDTPSQIDTPCQIDTPSQSDTPSQIERPPSQIDTTPPVRLSGTPSQSERLSVIDPSVDTSEIHQGGTRTRATRATRIPDDFTVTDDMVTWAREHTPLVGRAETALFVDYWQSESGPRSRKSDWRKAWQVWMRREQKKAEQRPAHLRSVPAPVRPTDPADAFADIRRRGAALEASRLLGIAYIPTPQPPSDKTPAQQWARDRAVEWIDAHEQELRAALTERKTG